ncbi:MAG: hypothetical protein Q8R13_04475, partial [bacterium]|nr:hypothetical protein [bacterium]
MKGTTWWSRMLLALIGLTFVARILEAECAEYYRIIPLGVAAQSIMGLSWIAKKTEGHELAQT